MGSYTPYLDYHVHEHHSGDARDAYVEGYARRAEELGLDEIALTTHLIIKGPDKNVGINPGDIPDYLEEIDQAQDETKVRLLSGLEVDYFPEEERLLEKILDEHAFDVVLGSTHFINGCDIGSREQNEAFFQDRPPSEATDEYYSVWRKAVESQLFDVMAHPDYFRKYIHLFREPLTWGEFGSEVSEAIYTLSDYDVGIEVNTSGYRHGMGDSFPLTEFLRKAKKVGVNTVTVGSDCHIIENLGYRISHAMDKLRKAGFNYISVFKDRRNKKEPIKMVSRSEV